VRPQVPRWGAQSIANERLGGRIGKTTPLKRTWPERRLLGDSGQFQLAQSRGFKRIGAQQDIDGTIKPKWIYWSTKIKLAANNTLARHRTAKINITTSKRVDI
jgi:hypothetical protein